MRAVVLLAALAAACPSAPEKRACTKTSSGTWDGACLPRDAKGAWI
jgi:hypothetical protein